MEIPKVTITYETICPITDKAIKREIEPSQILVSTIQSMYDDVDNGHEFVDNFRCEHCNRYHDITLFKDSVFGGW
jgi:hypothetical protein